MNPIKALLNADQKVVDVLERFCHWQQRWLGTSHYTWLRLFTIIHIVIFYTINGLGGSPVEWVVLSVLLTFLPLSVWWEKKSLDRRQKGFANPLRKMIEAIILRFTVGYFATALLLFASVYEVLITADRFVIITLINVYWLSFISIYILPACDPLPPTTSKVREWLEKTFLKPAST